MSQHEKNVQMVASQIEMNYAYNIAVQTLQEAVELVGSLVSVDSATFEKGKALAMKRIAVPQMGKEMPLDEEIAEYYARR